MRKKTAAIISAVFAAAVMAFSFGAAEKTPVKMSVSSEQAGAGSDYTVYISLGDVPSGGLSSVDFAVEYDKSKVTVDKVTSLLGAKVGTDGEVFDYYKTDSAVNVCWIASGDSLLKSDGRAFSISGKVLSGASAGSKAKINIVPVSRQLYAGSEEKNSKIGVSCVTDSSGENYDCTVSEGYVTVTANGDVNVDGVVDGEDAAIVLKHIMLGKNIESPYSAAAADCAQPYGTIDTRDAVWILNHVSYGGTALDISNPSMGECTYKNGVLSAKGVNLFGIALTKTLSEGDSVKVYIRAKDNAGSGFRCWLSDGSGTAYSEGNTSADVFKPGTSGEKLTFTRTATNTADRLLIKAPTYDSTIEDLEIEYIGVEYISGSSKETTTEPTTQGTAASGGHSHSFSAGLTDSFFTITGNLSKDKGSVTYNNEVISQCLKMETNTSISYSTGNSGVLTLVFNTDSAGNSVYVDGTSHKIPQNGILTVNIGSGSHTVGKNSGSSFLYYMNVS